MTKYATASYTKLPIHAKTAEDIAHEEEIDAQLAAGWGDVRQDRIPKNWRELQAPKKKGGPKRKKDIEGEVKD